MASLQRAKVATAAGLLATLFLVTSAHAQGQGQARPGEGPVDCATTFNDAGALRDRHALKDARAHYQLCAQPTCPSFVAMCQGLARDVDATIPTLILRAHAVGGAALTAVTVTMDGAPFATTLDGAALEVEPPGKHTFLLRADGFDPLTRELEVPEGHKGQVEAVTFQPIVAVAAPTPTPAPPSPSAPAPLAPSGGAPLAPSGGAPLAPAVQAPAASGWSAQRTYALAAGGVGVAGLVVGSVFGAGASSTWSSARNECKPGACADGSAAQSDRSTALSKATLSTVFFLVGGLGVAGGVVLWVTAPSHGQPAGTGLRLAPRLGVANAGLDLAGDF